MVAVLGIVGLVLALFTAGAFMENNLRKMAGFGTAFVVCCVLILATSAPRRGGPFQDCFTDWDARSNATVCE